MNEGTKGGTKALGESKGLEFPHIKIISVFENRMKLGQIKGKGK